MREYGKVSPKFWVGKTGKALRKQGVEAQVVGMYLMTAPSSNMLGLYYLPIGHIAHETGLGIEGASKGLRRAIEAGFCDYDEEAEVVWVYEMASYQIADQLQPNDKRSIGVQNEYNDLPENKHLGAFFKRYQAAFHLTFDRGNTSPIEAPSKPLRSQEQEQEQEQEKEQEQEQKNIAAADASAKKNQSKQSLEPNPNNLLTWQAYKGAYAERYGVAPVQNAKSNSIIKQVVQALGAEAIAVAAFYVRHNDRNYVLKMHQLNLLLADHAKLRTEWATNQRMTSTKAHQTDKTATNLDAFAELIAEAEAREQQEGHHAEQ